MPGYRPVPGVGMAMPPDECASQPVTGRFDMAIGRDVVIAPD